VTSESFVVMNAAGELAGKVVVVIGGSSGIGLATAHAARNAGASVTIAGRDAKRLRTAGEELGAGTRTVQVDARDEDAVSRLFTELAHVDHVVVLAGEQPIGLLVEANTADFRRAMDARFWSAVNVCKHAPPRMGGEGSITLCSGVVAHKPQPTRSLGTASTAAVEAFGRAMAVELAPIRVNTIVPGPTDTPMLRRFFGAVAGERLAAVSARTPVGRIGRADEVADAILFLMRNGFVSGVTLPIDGGFLLT
jgi:NAD(P)-dependent dehydrogenase (short-subunit alcohol dehydrogenase family)